MNLSQRIKCPNETPFFKTPYQHGPIDLGTVMQYILLNKQKWKRQELLPADFQSDSVIQTCNSFRFNTQRHDLPPVNQAQEQDMSIPLMKRSSMGPCKQFVFGRTTELIPYYRDERFITLDLSYEMWSDNHTYTMEMNDFFVLCAVMSNKSCPSRLRKNFFPIRLVFNRRDAVLFKRAVSSHKRYADEKHSIGTYDSDFRFSSVMAREVCQLLNLFHCYLYQSTTYPHLFFMKRGPIEDSKGLELLTVGNDQKFYTVPKNAQT